MKFIRALALASLFVLPISTPLRLEAQNAALMPMPKLQFFDQNGIPLAGGLIYTYAAGTTTPLATYTDSTASVQNTNPVVLDSGGFASIWLGPSAYKIVAQNSTGVTVWTQDNVSNLALLVKSGQNGAALVSYTAAATGSVARTVASKLGDAVSVKDFGAKGDGATNDSAAFAAAIAAAPGGQIDLPGGSTYVLASGLTLTNNQVLDCHGSTLQAGAAGIAVINAGGSEIKVRNCSITQGGYVNVTAISITTDANNFRVFDSFDHISIIGSGGDQWGAGGFLRGIYIYDGTGKGNYYHSFHDIDLRYTQTGILLDASQQIYQVNRSTFDTVTIRNSGTAVLINEANTTNFTNLSMEGCAAGLTIANNPGNNYTFISGYRAEVIQNNKAIDLQGPNVSLTEIIASGVDSPYLINDQGTNTRILTPVYTNTQHFVGLNLYDDSYAQTPLTQTNGVTLQQIITGPNQGTSDLLRFCPFQSYGTALACPNKMTYVDSTGVIHARPTAAGGGGTVAQYWEDSANNPVANLSTGGVLTLNAGTPAIQALTSNSASRAAIIQFNAGFSANYNGIWIAANQNNSNAQANASLPSWAVDVGGSDNVNHPGVSDHVSFYRQAAGGSWARMGGINSSGQFDSQGSVGLTTTVTTGSCTMTFTGGLLTAKSGC